MIASLDRLAARATALVLALAFTSATLAVVDVLAHHDRAAQVTQTSSSVERG
jgi:hypothetical protein